MKNNKNHVKAFFKGLVVGKDSLESRAKAFIKNKSIGIAIKVMLLPLISVITTFLLPIILLSVLVFFLLFMVSLEQQEALQKENAIYNSEGQLQNVGSKTIFNSKNSNGEAKSFDNLSPVPHGWPTSGKLGQLYCSNFYWSGHKYNIGYVSHAGQLIWEKKCIDKMKKKPAYKDFAQNYTGGNWKIIGTHGGIDIFCPEKTNVYSMSHGLVVESSKDSVWGNYVDIESEVEGNRYIVRYAHLKERKVKKKNRVYAGELLGLSGKTGNVQGPHLHVSICENGNSKSLCYSKEKDVTMLDPLPFMLNYEYNGKKNVDVSNEDTLLGDKVFSGVGKPGLDLIKDYNISLDGIDLDNKVTKEIAEKIRLKIGEQEGIHPLLIKALHKKERSLSLSNPQPVHGKDGWSGKNEGLYGIYNNFESLTPYCKRSEENFGKLDGKAITIKQYQNQTLCAAKVLKYKFGSKNLDKLSVTGLKVETNSDKKTFCSLIAGYNPGPFYCWNNLYPTYSKNTSYKNMRVISGGKLIGYHRSDGILKIVLDEWENFKIILNNYKKEEKDLE